MKKSELRQLIKEEYNSIQRVKEIFNSFKEDLDNHTKYASAFLENNMVIIYLDNNPNEEKNIINKLIRTKYKNKINKIRSEDDIMTFSIKA